MRENFKEKAVLGLCTLGLIGMGSCLKIDDAYDLEKEIDKTITVGGDLTLPGSNTEQMLLGDLLELDKDGVIQANEISGDYALVKEGIQENTEVEIPDVTLDMSGGFYGFTISEEIMGIPLKDVQTEIKESIKIDVRQGGLSSIIQDINNGSTICEETYLRLSKSGVNGVSARMEDGYRIVFPEYVRVISENADWTGEGNKLVLNRAGGLEIEENTAIKFQIVYVDFTKEGAEFVYNADETDNSSINLSGEILFDGKIIVNSDGTDSGMLELHINVDSQKLIIEEVNAVVKPVIDLKVEPIEITDLPDFLASNDVKLDLTDPRIFITLTNPSTLSVNMSAALKSSKTGYEDRTAVVPEFNIPAQCENFMICINQIKEGDELGIRYVKVDNLSRIIENVPERIEIYDIVTNVVQEPVDIRLNDVFTITTDYKVNTPLMFGADTRINYSKTIDGWNTDLENAEFKAVEASMKIINKIPLGVNLTAVAIDKEGKELQGVKVDMDVNIEPGSIEVPTEKEIAFTVTTESGSIKGLDGIILNVNAWSRENTENVALNENQTMQFTDIKLKLKGGVTMDLN